MLFLNTIKLKFKWTMTIGPTISDIFIMKVKHNNSIFGPNGKMLESSSQNKKNIKMHKFLQKMKNNKEKKFYRKVLNVKVSSFYKFKISVKFPLKFQLY